MERLIRREAHAKINVFLRVLGRRPDGYHDIDTLIVPVSLADEVTVRPASELRLSVGGPLRDQVPMDESNLVVRAARAMASRCEVDAGAEIELTKVIPVAAGLGGGSADAAATLFALSGLWGRDLGDDLLELAADVGSDVPALLLGGPVRASGRGEVVERVEFQPSWWVLLPLPLHVSVADAYRWWDEDGGPQGVAANDLQRPVARRHPEIEEAVRRLGEAGATDGMMCGSGPTVIGRAKDEQQARRIADAVPGPIPVSSPP